MLYRRAARHAGELVARQRAAGALALAAIEQHCFKQHLGREWADVRSQLLQTVRELKWAVNTEPAKPEQVHQTLLTGLLGINVGGIPGTNDPWAFSIVCAVLVVIGAGQVWLFRRMGLF